MPKVSNRPKRYVPKETEESLRRLNLRFMGSGTALKHKMPEHWDTPWNRILMVFGTRDFANYNYMEWKLNLLTYDWNSLILVEGGQSLYRPGERIRLGVEYIGADFLAGVWHWRNRHKYRLCFHPDLKTYGSPKAFYVRNREMVKFCASRKDSLAVAFWDGKSKGTASVIDLCGKYDLKLKIARYK